MSIKNLDVWNNIFQIKFMLSILNIIWKNNLFRRKQHRTRITVLVDMYDRYHYTNFQSQTNKTTAYIFASDSHYGLLIFKMQNKNNLFMKR